MKHHTLSVSITGKGNRKCPERSNRNLLFMTVYVILVFTALPVHAWTQADCNAGCDLQCNGESPEYDTGSCNSCLSYCNSQYTPTPTLTPTPTPTTTQAGGTTATCADINAGETSYYTGISDCEYIALYPTNNPTNTLCMGIWGGGMTCGLTGNGQVYYPVSSPGSYTWVSALGSQWDTCTFTVTGPTPTPTPTPTTTVVGCPYYCGYDSYCGYYTAGGESCHEVAGNSCENECSAAACAGCSVPTPTPTPTPAHCGYDQCSQIANVSSYNACVACNGAAYCDGLCGTTAHCGFTSCSVLDTLGFFNDCVACNGIAYCESIL